MQSSKRLFRSLVTFYEKLPNVNGEENGNAGLEVAALQLDAVMELPQVNTRAGLYIFLNALVSHTDVELVYC